MIAQNLDNKHELLKFVAMHLSGFAGFFDLLENIQIIYMIETKAAMLSFIPLATSLCASIKFSLLAVNLILSLVLILLKKRNAQ